MEDAKRRLADQKLRIIGARAGIDMPPTLMGEQMIMSEASWQELHDTRNACAKLMNAALDQAQEENRVLNDEEQSAFDAAERTFKAMDKEIKWRAKTGQREGKPPGGGWHSGRQEPPEGMRLGPQHSMAEALGLNSSQFGLGDVVRASLGMDDNVSKQLRSEMGIGTGSTGGFTVPERLSAQIIDLARNATRVVEAGAITVPVTSSTTFALQEKDPEAHWRGEHQEIPESEVEFSATTFKPNTLAVLVKLSIELVEDAPNVNTLVEMAIAKALGEKLDAMCLTGSGLIRPLGLLNTAGVHRLPVPESPPYLSNYDLLSKAVEAVRGVNAEPGAFIMSTRTDGELDRLKNQQNDPMRPPRSVAERRFLATNQVPNDMGDDGDETVIFTGAWPSLYIAMRTGLVLEATRYAGDGFKKMQVWVRGYLRADAHAVRPNHFAIIEGIKSPA